MQDFEEHLDPGPVMEPRGKLPGPGYLAKAFLIYLAWAVLAGILMFVGILVYAFPIGIAIFILGIAFTIVSHKLWTSAGIGRFVARHTHHDSPRRTA